MSLWDFEFMQRALVAAAVAGPVCALLGVFVTLRGMAFFSDAVAHAALTGVALSLLLEQALAQWGARLPGGAEPVLLLVFCLGIAGLMAWLFERTSLRADTVVAFCFTGSVAFGVLVMKKLEGYRNLDATLFGDINAIAWSDVVWLGALAALAVAFVGFNLRGLTLSTLQPDLARSDGLPARRLNYLLVMLVAAMVAFLIKMFGALLLSALIVIPAAAGKLFAMSFRGMLVLSVVLGLVCATGGVLAAWEFDTATGPTIVLVNLAPLAAAIGWDLVRRRRLHRRGRGGAVPLDQAGSA